MSTLPFPIFKSHPHNSAGTVVVKPGKSWSIAAGVAGAVDSLTRGLAVDLAPIRVNVISPGAIDTEVRLLSLPMINTTLRNI